MPCLHEQDLAELAGLHITAQKANIQNQRTRLGEITEDLRQLKSSSDSNLLRLQEAQNAVNDLEYHLNGRVRRSLLEDEATELQKNGLNPNRLKRVRESLKDDGELVKDPDLDVAEVRTKVMEALYKERQQFVFEDTAHDKDKEGNSIPRYASVFGAPTVKKLKEAGEEVISLDLMLRSISMVTGGESTKNPNDYLDTAGTEVKKSLSDGIEHHHIYNNVYVDENGKVKPNSVRFFRNPSTGDIEMQVIPEYWNSEKHGRNTQFIELMDGAHSGDDTATHLHYYKLDGDDDAFVRQKIRDKVSEIVSANTAKVPKLETELKELSSRRADPKAYEDKLLGEINLHNSQIEQLNQGEAKYATPNKSGSMVKNKGLSPVQEAELAKIRGDRATIKKTQDKVQKALDEHRSFVNIESDIKEWEHVAGDTESKAKAIKLNVKFPTVDFDTKEAAKNAKFQLESDAKELRIKAKNSKQVLRDKGSVDQQIKDKFAKLQEAKDLASLTEQQAISIYEKSNGYLHFDKGSQESQDYSKSRPKMNAEIHKLNARQAVEELESQHGDNSIKALQDIARSNYRRNLFYNLKPLVDKVAGTL
ncbi:hypothetical protein [Nostoc sp.]|uniref:hypothetical protein n=1 Tax=Nostoc sp. TaxID=1180 RepID=UPI002FFB450E